MRLIYNDFCNFNDIEILSYLVASITEKDEKFIFDLINLLRKQLLISKH